MLDPRDRVFALMSMSKDYASWPVKYEDSPIALFKELQCTINRRLSIRFAKQVSSMLELDSQVSEADNTADEIEFDGTPICRFDTWAADIIYPPTSGDDSATSYRLPSGLTRFELQFCKIFETTVSLIVLPTDDDVVFSVFGVISGNNVGHAQWLRHRCTIIAESKQALEDFMYGLQYRLVPPSLVALVELLATIDMEDLVFSKSNFERSIPQYYYAN